MITLKVKKLRPTALRPVSKYDAAAGFDLSADLEKDWIQIDPGETKLVGTGLAISVPKRYWAGIYARSGLATKDGLRPANCVGVIDPDYRGEVMVPIHNDSKEAKIIFNHDRIAQLILHRRLRVKIKEVMDLDATKREKRGFGSSGH